MAGELRITLVQLRRDTSANWTTVNPVLRAGEPGYETDTRMMKVGDGATAWSGLGYLVASGGGGGGASVSDVTFASSWNGVTTDAPSKNAVYDEMIKRLAVFRPEVYGAVGDGTTNDTVAFQNMATAINAADGGVIEFTPGATYIVGLQTLTNNGTWMYTGQTILKLDACGKGVIIRGNGAKMKLAAGLRFGTFNSSGVATTHTQPYTVNTERAAPIGGYGGIIEINTCTGPVEVRNIELDGNVNNQTIGGPWGDTGWQLPGDGLILTENTGGEIVENVYSHDHCRDACMTWRTGTGEAQVKYPSTYRNCQFIKGWRQGLSLVGGRGWLFENCKFNDTGKATIQVTKGMSSPSAGIDLEAETGPIRDINFIGCEFSNNTGIGLLPVGDVANVQAYACTFVGTTAGSLWPAAPYMSFRDCLMVGEVYSFFSGSGDDKRAARFYNCRFSAATGRSPTGAVFLGSGVLFVDCGIADSGTLFDNCIFDTEGNTSAQLPWSAAAQVKYRDCQFKQDGTAVSSVCRGRFYGLNIFTITASGVNDFYDSKNYGSVVVNGVASLGRRIAEPVSGDDSANGYTLNIYSNVAMGANFTGSTATPVYLDLGASFGDVLANGIKFRMYNAGGASSTWYGFGMIGNQMYSWTPTGATFRDYIGGTERFQVNATGAAVNGQLTVTDQAYGAGWDGNFEVPTKNAVYDKIQTVVAGGGGGVTTNAVTFTTTGGAAAGTTFDGSVARTIDYSTVGAAKTGLATGSGLTITTGKLLGRTTAATGALEEITPSAALSLTAGGLTIAAAGVTSAMMVNMAALSVKGNATNASAVPTDIAAGTDGHVLRRSGTAIGFGTLASGAFASNTMAPATVAFSATSRFLGRITTAAGAGEELTGTQATTLLDAFTSALKGLAPASGGGTVNFLRADGTWAVPPGGGGGVSDGDKGDVVISGTGTVYTVEAASGNFAVTGDVTIGNHTGTSTATPRYIDMGGTFGNSMVNGSKLWLYTLDRIDGHVLGVQGGESFWRATSGTDAIGLYISGTRRLQAHNTGVDITGALSVSGASNGLMAANTIKGNNTGSAAASVDLTVAQVKAMLTPAVQSVVSAATVTPTFANDQVNITALAVACQLLNPTGTAVEGKKLIVRIKDAGTAKALTYDTQYRAMGGALPTTTVAGKTMYLGFIYNATDTKWDFVSLRQEA